MLKTIAGLLIFICFALLVLSLVLIVATALFVTVAALAYRLMPGSNVPLTYNLRNMLVRWKNTVVTAAAFTVVIGLLTVMLAFVAGMYNLTENSGRPGNVMVLQSGSNDESFSNLPVGADILRLPTSVQQAILRDSNGF